MGKRVKIIATLGPATSNLDSIKKLIVCGVDVFRLNFSHGSHRDHATLVKRIRASSSELNKPVGIIQDLQGPKIRTGKVHGDSRVKLLTGHTVTIKHTGFTNNRIGPCICRAIFNRLTYSKSIWKILPFKVN